MNDRKALASLIQSGHCCLAISTLEEEYALGLVREIAVAGNRPAWMWSVSGGVQDAVVAGSVLVPETEDPVSGLSHFGQLSNSPLCITLDLAAHVREERTLRVLRNLLHQFQGTGSQLIMIDYLEELPQVIAEYTTRFPISLPDEQELEQIVVETLRRAHRERVIDIHMPRSGLRTIVRNLRGLSRRQAQEIIVDTVALDRRFDESDINTVLAGKRQALHKGRLLEYIEVPVSLAEIGGLKRLKSWLAQRQNAFGEQAQNFGLTPPRGVLLLGVQGAGKSLCAKAIATAWRQPLLRMDVGALYDRYVGESERRLREALQQAEVMSPLILWIDEIEKAFASAASHNTDGGLSQRMFATLLTWMQERAAAVFLVATANDIDALPPELLRKGRFDEIFFVDLPQRETRRDIFAIHLKKRRRDPAMFDLDRLADVASGFSGAEIEQVVVAALYDAYSAGVDLATEHIERAIQTSPPLSITMAERVEALRAWAEGRCVPAD